MGKFLRRTLESFDYARARGGGDCEDMALEIILNALELAALDRRPNLPPIVRGLLNLSNQFVKCMVLGGVSSAEISGDFASAKGMGAHMWAVMVQLSRWAEWWRAGNLLDEDFARSARLPPPGTPDNNAYPSVFVLEGTGFLRPEGCTSSAQDVERRRVEQGYYAVFDRVPNKAFSGLSRWFDYKRGEESSFYKVVSVLFTPQFLSVDPARRFVEFAVCKRDTATTGMPFTDFVAGSRSIALWSMPPMNAVETALCRSVMDDLPPLPKHVAPATIGGGGDEAALSTDTITAGRIGQSLATHRYAPDLLYEARLVQRLQSEIGSPAKNIGEPRDGGGGDDDADKIPNVLPIEMFCKHGQLDESRATRLIEACNALGIKRVECTKEEPSRGGLYAWRLTLHCPCLSPSQFRELKTRVGRMPGAPPQATFVDDYEESAP